MEKRIVDKEITLIPYYRNDEVSLPWYQDLDVCKQIFILLTNKVRKCLNLLDL